MQTVPIAPVPNQRFFVTLNEVRWGLSFKTGNGFICCDVDRDNERLISGMRVLAGEPIIPYSYLQTGNFIFVVRDDELPDYSGFGSSQFLVYLTAAEIAALPPATYNSPPTLKYLVTDDGFYLTSDTGELLTDG